MLREADLREILKDTASSMAEYNPNPSTWLSWIVFLLQELQQQSMAPEPLYQDLYHDLLGYLQESIRNRLRTGGW